MSAEHGLEALQQMETASPDIIISDISMPEMDGFAFYDAVRSRIDWVTIPFIFLTARGEREDIFTSKKLGVEDYLVKPVDPKELVTTIRSRLERGQQLMLAQMEQAYEASLIMLANAIELRDKYTRGHVERVMRYSMLIARRLGWTAAQMRPLQFGAILHDIGKIYIREDVLRKRSRLNREEWGEMKEHALVGAGLLQSISYLSEVIPIIRHHHERWDGNGYPGIGRRGDTPSRSYCCGSRFVRCHDHDAGLSACQLAARSVRRNHVWQRYSLRSRNCGSFQSGVAPILVDAGIPQKLSPSWRESRN